MITAKFKVISIERSQTSTPQLDAQGRPKKDPQGNTIWDQAEVRAISLTASAPHDASDKDNAAVWQGNPSGSIRLGRMILAAADQFELGQEYTVTFTKVGGS